MSIFQIKNREPDLILLLFSFKSAVQTELISEIATHRSIDMIRRYVPDTFN